MRLRLHISKSNTILPFNYQPILSSCLHKWLGKNNQIHDKISLYSFSWLQNVKVNKKGIETTASTYCFYSFYDVQLAKKVIDAILKDPIILDDIHVNDIMVQEAPNFNNQEIFYLSSPALVKSTDDQGNVNHYTYSDEESGKIMTRILKTKLEGAKIGTEGLNLEFVKNYPKAKTKVIDYKGIKNKTNICPIKIQGTPEQIAFAWNVGVGNSTGIGFGSLK